MSDSAQRQLDDVLSDVIWAILSDVHTISIGQIVSFDTATNLASVQIVNKRRYELSDEAKPLAVCKDVPVLFPGDGEISMVFEPKKGAYCIMLFSERSIDVWFNTGGIVDPNSARKFDLADGVAIVGINPRAGAFADIMPGVSLRNRANTTYLNVQEGVITMQTTAGNATLGADGSFDVNHNFRVIV